MCNFIHMRTVYTAHLNLDARVKERTAEAFRRLLIQWSQLTGFFTADTARFSPEVLSKHFGVIGGGEIKSTFGVAAHTGVLIAIRTNASIPDAIFLADAPNRILQSFVPSISSSISSGAWDHRQG